LTLLFDVVTVATGKGRGLVATQPLQPGQLLLVTPPLALVEGDLGEIPDHDELQEVMASSGAKFTPWQAAWLKTLVCSTEQDDSSSSSSDSNLAVPDMLPPAGYNSWYGELAAGSTAAAAAVAAAGSGAAADRVPFEELGMSDERLWAAIGECAMCEDSRQQAGRVYICALYVSALLRVFLSVLRYQRLAITWCMSHNLFLSMVLLLLLFVMLLPC
jgi:hypothetical protein